MRIYTGDKDSLPAARRGLALGFFDGLHRGHAELVHTLLSLCGLRGLTSAVFTFANHPEHVLKPDKPFAYLGTAEERLALLDEMGLDEAHLADFTPELAALSAGTFLEELIAGRFLAQLLVVGPDYRFGARGEGDVALLRTWTAKRGIELVVVDEVVMGAGKISSSRIRSLIQAGEVDQAATLLGRPYSLGGIVLSGRRLGRTLGFPTANLPLPPGKVCPALGVYATRVLALGQTWEAITSIGLRPTVSPDETTPVIETHIFDADLHLYGETITIELLAFIRPEQRFDSLAALSEQIKADLEQVRGWHRGSEQCYEKTRSGGVPLFLLSSRRFAQASLHLVFQTQATPRQLACNALLVEVLTATCRTYPDRTRLALALDTLYGASLEGHAGKSGDIQTLVFSVDALARWTDGSSPFQAACDLLFAALLEPDLDADDGLFRTSIVESERTNLLLSLQARANDRLKWTYDRCLEQFCGGQVHGLPAIGRACDLEAVSREDLLESYHDLLHNMQLSVYLGGPVDQSLLEHVAALLKRLPQAVRPRLKPGLQPAPCHSAAPGRDVTVKPVEQARLVLAYDGLPAYFAHQSSVAVLLNSMLGGDVHSLLFDVIREQMGLAYQVFSMSQRFLSALFILAGVAPDQLEAAEKAIQEQVERLAGGRFDDALMQRSKMMLTSALKAAGDDMSSLLSREVSGRLTGRLLHVQDSIRLIEAVTREQVIDLACQLRLRTTVILTGQPDHKAEEN
ncbi:MAG: bifunctional riboflavin kinase/FAD synthetase [Clostridiaceae bacterium]|nr:bifunctional riboflavin kinase/FAD synthetase [Clostridiaceae bacterium]